MDVKKQGKSEKSCCIGFNVEDYLARHGARPLAGGKSGAQVYDIEGKYVLKRVQRQALWDDAQYAAYRREALWYESAADSGLQCLPEIIDIRNTDDEIVILMKRYRTLSREEFAVRLQQGGTGNAAVCRCMSSIMEALAAVHTAAIPAFLLQERHAARPLTDAQIKASVEGWRSVLREHPGAFDESVLERIAAEINEIIRWHDSEKAVLNHGDFHWDNLLQNEKGDIIICDWQGVSAGQASGDLSFFFGRLRADNIRLDEQEAVTFYAQEIKRLSGRIVTWEEIDAHMRAADVITSFVFWHQYLHGNLEERVRGIYEGMISGAAVLSGFFREALLR